MEAWLDRFWEKVNKRSASHCWEWTASKFWNGYGCFYIKGKLYKAHRVSWVIANGKLLNGECVLHSCDNPPCVNPAHLFTGSQQDNLRDKHKKRRMKHKLSEKDVTGIRNSALTQKELAAKYKVDQSTISVIMNNKVWK